MATNELAVQTARTVQTQLKKNREKILSTLPKGFNYDRSCGVVINAINSTPAVANCTPTSIFLATIAGFRCNIEPNGPLQKGYLVPFKNSKKGIMEAKFMPSYRGLIDLMRRSPEVNNIYAHEVKEKDKITVSQGTNKQIKHEFPANPFSDRGKTIGYYSVVEYADGTKDFETMDLAQIEEVRETSKSKNSGPWVTWYDEMAKKTVVKRLSKRVPMSIEAALAVKADHQIATGDFKDDVIDIEGIELPNQEVQEYAKPQPKAQPTAPTNPPVQNNAQQPQKDTRLISDGQVKRLWAIAKKANRDNKVIHDYIKYYYNIDSMTNILKDNYEAICEWAEGGAPFNIPQEPSAQHQATTDQPQNTPTKQAPVGNSDDDLAF